MRRRAVLPGMLLAGAARAQAPIGTARMEQDGTIVVDLVAREGAAVGHGRLVYPPGHPDHGMILRHLGGLRPGEVKPVPPFP
ncbi:hypothetical protein [Roseomonas sp. CECT 9278]|uniref:hypothetical protein n=1 Tax=Roseomonas sp. CECT 9278 TaxID=2845823 RepID=UPI001E2A477A|nr:hypothetical protein [Roseomonas sp. CECT 9278]CAH0228081.1 hypothetical protein ROS9278_02581 [Roseomonas sp. CECT 9278]